MTSDELVPDPGEERPKPSLPVLRPKDREWTLDDPMDTAVAFEVVEAVAFGRTLIEIEKEPWAPPATLFLVWCMKQPQLAQAFNRAREISGFILEDELLHLLREGHKNPESALKAKHLQMLTEGMWKIIAKRNPAVFSDKASVNLTVPISIQTTLDMGKDGAAQKHDSEIPNIYQMRAEVAVEIPQDLPQEIAQRDPETGKRRKRELKVGEVTKRTGVKQLKRILVPKRRAAETAEERALREEAERQLRIRREKRRREMGRYREKVKARTVTLGGDDADA